MTENRAIDWSNQAHDDLRSAEALFREKFYAQCCFISQQVAEKALKSIALRRGARAVFTHSLFKLCEELQINGVLQEAALDLDHYYVSARYPDAFPGGAPYQLFREKQAVEALESARLFLVAADKEGL